MGKLIECNKNVVVISIWVLMSAMRTSAISFREQPESATVIAGDTVKLHCSVNNQADIKLYWQNLDSASYISLNNRISPYGQLGQDQLVRYTIRGNSQRGEYHLQIKNVSKADEGRYACVFFLNFNYYSQVAKLRVVRPPDRGYPKCAVDPIKRANVGDNITLNCESRGGDPPSTLSWVRGTTRLVTQRGRLAKGDPTVQYSLTLTEDDSDVRFTCVANNPALQQPRTCSITPLRSSLGVLLRPVVASVEVGESFTFACITERMPNLAYQWYINNDPIDGRESRFTYIRGGQRLLIEAVTMEDDYALVKCEVTQKDYSYSGSAVGLLWVQSNNIGTPDIVETTIVPPLPKRISTQSRMTTLRATTTTSMATTATLLTTTEATTTVATTPTSPPTSTIATTTPLPTTTSKPTTRALIPEVPLIVNDGNIATYESSSSSSVYSSSFSSVSSLSSENDAPPAVNTASQVDNVPPTDVESSDQASATAVNSIEPVNEIVPSHTTAKEPNPEENTEETNTIEEKHATPSVEESSPENSNIVADAFVTPSTQGTVVDNEIVAAGTQETTDVVDIGSGDEMDNDINGLTMFTETGPQLPNEVGYKTGRLRGTPNWGLIAGLFVVFVLVVVALSALVVYLYRRRNKEPKAKPST